MTGKLAGIILAGGRGSRMGTEVPKQFLEIAGQPMIWHTLRAFEDSIAEELVLVAPEDGTEYCRKEIVEKYGFQKVRHIVEGGAERYDSVYAGLLALKDSGCSLVAVQDGARCMVTPDIICRSYEAAEQYGACVIAVPSKDTMKMADEDGFAAETLPRQRLWTIQTPQTFRYDLCLRAYSTMMSSPETKAGVTDDAMVVEHFTDTKVKLVMGDYRNIKVTTKEDLAAAEAYLAEKN
ncbi:MAG: 2-C-methyl-D-erythritol 4-phosphate cytidylyltransferase [Stomatobaculum sp.]|nr:2-C-methyl-D-erythritol 4-phosphate cytidylyltransferase [Stomatobaculum sp.]